MRVNDKKISLSRDVLAYVPVKLIPAVTGLLSIIILTRNLAPQEYGRYSVVITTILLLVQLGGTWLSNSVLYLYPECVDEKSQFEFRRQTINLQLLVSIPAMGIAYVAIYIATYMQLLALAGVVLVFGQLMQGLLMTFLQSSRKIYIQAISVGVQCIFQLGTLSLLVFFANGKETAAVFAVIFGFFSGNIVLLFFNRGFKSGVRERFLISHKFFLSLLNYGMPMCIWFFATQSYMIGDRIVLQLLGLSSQLGQYASFRDLATGCAGFLTMPLLMAAHPIIMAKWKSKCKPEEIEEIIGNNIILLAMLFIPLILMIDVVGYDMIVALFGQRYALSEGVMVLVVISIFTGSMAIHLQKGLEVTGKTLLMAKMALIAAVFSMIANVIFIPKFGVFGGAVVVVSSSIFYLGMVFVAVRNILLPRIPVIFWIRLVVWFILVEIIIRFLENFLQKYIDRSFVLISIGFCFCFFTIILFLLDYKIRRFIFSFVGSFRKI